MDVLQKSAMARTRRKQIKPQRKKVDDDLDETSLTEGSLHGTMSPDSNHNLHLIAEKRDHLRNGFIEDDQEAVIKAMESCGMMNSSRNADDSFDDSLDEGLGSQKYFSAGTPSSDLVIDERSMGSPDMSESRHHTEEESSDTVPGSGLLPVDIMNGGDRETVDFASSSLKCGLCQKLCSGYERLREHLSACHPEPPKDFSCLQCNLSFANRDLLDKHEAIHSPNAHVACKTCHKTFANVYRLQRHMISHDESAVLRKFKCPECEKAFKFKHHLKEHVRIHSGEKPFKCQNCGKRFSHSGSYSSHMTSKKCLIMNLKINQRTSRGNVATGGDATSPSKPKSNHIASNKNEANNHLHHINNNNSNAANNNNTLNNHQVSASSNEIQHHHSTINTNHVNNNNIIFAAGMPKSYADAASLLLPAFANTGLPNPYFLQANVGMNQHGLPYSFSPEFTQHFLALSANYRDAKDALSEEAVVAAAAAAAAKSHAMLQNGGGDLRMAIKKEAKSEEDEEGGHQQQLHSIHYRRSPPMLPQSSMDDRQATAAGHHDFETIKREILERVNDTVTNELISKKDSPTCSSGCPSVSSEEHSPTGDDSNQQSPDGSACRACGLVFRSSADLHHHERFCCALMLGEQHNKKAEQHEGLAAKLQDVVSSGAGTANGVGPYHSDSDEENRGSGKEYLMTEDEDSETVENRKSRVRSQITEEQLQIMKQYYAVNPRPKREELEKISQKVGLQQRVVQVWFQNNRARDRREGKLVHIPYTTPAYEAYAASAAAAAAVSYFSPNISPAIQSSVEDEPLDLSTKKSFNSSPTMSPFRYDSDDYGAVNLSRKSPQAASPSSQLTISYAHPPSPLLMGKNLLKRSSVTPNGNGLPFSMDQLMFMHSRSPVTSSSPNNNGSCSPNSSDSHSWRQELMYANDGVDTMQEEPRSADEMVLMESPQQRAVVGTPTKKARLNNGGSGNSSGATPGLPNNGNHNSATAEPESYGQRPHKCDVCEKAFKHKHHLTEHKRLHSGEKPFQCKKCFKRFSHSGSFSQHMNHRFSYCKPYRE